MGCDGDPSMQIHASKKDPLIMKDGRITRAKAKKIKEAMLILIEEIKDKAQRDSTMGHMMNIIQVDRLDFHEELD